jgi:hypothetical protein
MDKVELITAYEWICDACGQQNFCSSVVFEFDKETEQEMREDHGIEAWETGDFCHIPDTVICKYCATKYITYDSRSDE